MNPADPTRPQAPPVDRSWIADSALAHCRHDAEAAISFEGFRPLRDDEIARLERQGNWARTWGEIWVNEDFSTGHVIGNRFEGPVTLGRLAGETEPDRLSGIFNSTLSRCAIGPGARVADCRRLHRCVVGAGAILEGIGRIEMSGESSAFGNDLELFHEELFSRRTRVGAEAPLDWAAWVSGPAASLAPEVASEMNAAIDAYAAALRFDRCIVAPGARILGAAAIENCFIGPHTTIEGAGSLRDSTIWGSPDEPAVVRDGADLRRALVGPGCLVESAAFVQDTILFEHVHVGHHATVKGSGVGPNSRLSGGETNDALLGPFSISIHQGLILAAWWPEGKGNIAYGSNVGSNHTGKAPDQEIWPGEGVFFGLGCSVKFPSNFREAPYSIIATGLTCMPQKVSFPFSLIAAPDRAREGVSPALNEIFPGWALANNAYGLERQERNQFARNRARRSRFPLGVLRPDLIDAMGAAAARLEPPPGGLRETYLEAQIPGLGKNLLSESARKEGVVAYRWGMRAAAARCVLMAMDRELEPPGEGRIAPAPWSRALAAWAGSILGASGARDAIAEALRLHREWSDAVLSSKARDDRRGRAILPDYDARHVTAPRDPVAAAVAADHGRFLSEQDAMKTLWDSSGA